MKISVDFAARAGFWALRGLASTWRFRLLSGNRARSAVPRRLSPAVYALWHEHLLPLCYFHRDHGAVTLVSRHRDGEILARVLRRLGYTPVRGSSTRGGSAGFRELLRAGVEGAPVALAPDGPLGPPRRCKPGVVRAAARTGLPLITTAAAASRSWRLRSWDRFLVPAPGATVCVSYGEPLAVPRESTSKSNETTLADGGRGALFEWTRRVEASLEAQDERCRACVAGR